MAGKATFRHPREPRVYWEEVRPVSALGLTTMGNALGRPLDAGEVEKIGRQLCHWTHAARMAREAPRPIDVVSTLRVLATTSDDPVADWDDADLTSRAFLQLARWQLRQPLDPGADDIRAAATLALRLYDEERTKKRGRSVTWLSGVAVEILQLWVSFGAAPSSGAASGDKVTPLNLFAQALFAELGQPKSASQIAKLLARARQAWAK